VKGCHAKLKFSIYQQLYSLGFILDHHWLGWFGGSVHTHAPELGPRWLFFFLSVIAITGTVMPFVAFLNRRFPSLPPALPGVIVRQALWIGIYFPILAWLRIPRLLTPSLALLLAIGLLLIEWLLRLRERSQWKP
jgi:hypothetical protein